MQTVNDLQIKDGQSIDELNRAVEAANEAVEATPLDHPDRASQLSNLGNWLGRRYKCTGEIIDLNWAVEVANEAVKATPLDYSHRAGRLSNLGNLLGMRYEQMGEMVDLNRAVEVADKAVEATPLNYPHRAGRLSNLGIWLGRRFEWMGEMADINRAIKVADEAVKATPIDHPDRAGYLNNLGSGLKIRFEWTGEMTDLNQAIQVTDKAVEATPLDHPYRATYLNNHGNRLGRRFERTGEIADLSRAVQAANEAVEATPLNHPDRADWLSNLGSWLGTRFERTGEMDDLNWAVKVTNEAVEATPLDHLHRAGCLNNLGNLLGMRFERMGEMTDLNRAVEVANEAAKATPLNNPDRTGYLNNLGSWLGMRFERTGEMADLNQAVKVTNEAVEATPLNHPDRAGWLNNLGSWLGRRFRRTGEMADLNRAIKVADEAVEVTPIDHPYRAGYLNNLGSWYGTRFERTGEMTDINRAIKVADEAVKATPIDHPDRAGHLNNLGSWLGRRFERTGEIADINLAVEVTNEAIEATPLDYSHRATYLSNLGNWLGRRFEQTGEITDLNQAIKVADEAIKATPLDYPDRAGRLSDLGNWIETRFKQTGATKDLESSLALYKQGWDCRTAPPSIRIEVARYAVSLLVSQLEWKESSNYLNDAVMLLPTVSTRLLQHTDKQHMLKDFSGLASAAAATALNAGKEAYKALELLELGRGVIAGLLLELRTDISDLKLQHPTFADEFVSLRNELDAPAEQIRLSVSEDDTSWELRARRRREADQRFEELIREIRTQPEFQRFLLPPTVDELTAAAQEGPIVVINVSPYRCDAFLIEPDRIRALSLPDLSLEDLEEKLQGLQTNRSSPMSDQMEAILEWLWDVIASPVLEALGFENPIVDDEWPRLWWIPTGPLCHLPLHAAGRHVQGSAETVLDRVLSSYSPSVKALIYSRQHSIRKPRTSSSDNVLLVAMPNTPGHSDLSFAMEEVARLRELCLLMHLNPIELSICDREGVLRHLRGCNIFHFAGHGRSHPIEPSQSSLLLNDWKTSPLTVADLRDQRLQENSPFLGYLSACSTGANSEEQLTDEAIHLVSAFQLAGFRHVVGTLWPVDDSCCVKVATYLYGTLQREGMTDQAVCRGLHMAIRMIRNDYIGTGLGRDGTLIEDEGGQDDSRPTQQNGAKFWAPYIHFGA